MPAFGTPMDTPANDSHKATLQHCRFFFLAGTHEVIKHCP